MTGVSKMIGLPAVARDAAAAAATTTPHSVGHVSALQLAVTVSAFTAGTAPTATFTLKGQGGDGQWYTLYATSALAAASSAVRSIGPGLETNVMIPGAVRLEVSYGGTPTDGTWSASLIGRA